MVLTLRQVEPEDLELLYCWANEPTTRQNAFHMEYITHERHIQWFREMLKSQETVIYICMAGEIPVGQLRFQIDRKEALISFSVDAEKRGCGIGTRLLALAQERLRKERPEVLVLKGEVKYGNTASMRAFEKNGYCRENGETFVVYRKEF